MLIKLLNGSEEKLNLRKYFVDVFGYCKSNFQKSVRNSLIKKYPRDYIFEEVYIKGEKFFLDFFIPSLKLVFEAHGNQHCEHIKFFHRTKRDFHKQLDIDNRKREFCKLNGFKLIEIYDN